MRVGPATMRGTAGSPRRWMARFLTLGTISFGSVTLGSLDAVGPQPMLSGCGRVTAEIVGKH